MAQIKLTDKDILYLRKVNLTVIPLVGDVRLIEDLRIRFDLTKTSVSAPNSGEIEIFNVSESTRSVFESKGARVFLDAGYTNTAATIFRGDISKPIHQSEPPDIITKLEVRDGNNRYRNARLDKGYPPGIRFNQVIQDLATEFKIPLASLIDIPNVQFANGLTLTGTIRDHLNYLTKKEGLEWSIQDETLQIIPKKKFTVDEVVVLTPETGLVKSPSKTKAGVEFESLLQPKLRPGRRVQIESKFFKGLYKVRKVQHKGDSLFGEFITKCEAV
ncbi:MAG: hypothetical protein GWN93_27065 [Deltaproteobacteria bacterium]|nr:hypothetical protein [Deltaproteobacteria bacterium]